MKSNKLNLINKSIAAIIDNNYNFSNQRNLQSVSLANKQILLALTF